MSCPLLPPLQAGEAMSDPVWMEQAECRTPGMDPAWWFPDTLGGIRYAQALCGGCPVRQDCLDYAMTNHLTYGVWGGKSETQRKELRRQAAQAQGRYAFPCVCIICGGEFFGGSTTAKLCEDPECRREHQRAVQRRYNLKRVES